MKETMSNHQLYWTKDAFSLNYSIFENGNVIGEVKDKSTSRSVKASIFGKKYIFESEGFFKPHILIIALDGKEVIGRIDFKLFRPQATVNIFGTQYFWKLDNMLGTKWSLVDQYEIIKVSADKRKEGNYSTDNDTAPVLLIVGLVIRNHFTKNGY